MKKIILLISMIQIISGTMQVALAETSENICQQTIAAIKNAANIPGSMKVTPSEVLADHREIIKNVYNVEFQEFKNDAMTIHFRISDVYGKTADQAREAVEYAIGTLQVTFITPTTADSHQIACYYNLYVPGPDTAMIATAWANIESTPV